MARATWDGIRQRVYERAHGCCEYCQTCEDHTGQVMQVDHIDPHGSDALENHCFSCWSINNSKRRELAFFDHADRGRGRAVQSSHAVLGRAF